ncbi:hypothetical protein [Nocardioides panacisoli]|uniref:Small CPxCG-related zinc finger protein n=1 Tax=Nocardioides panacisoli TaxID=627624 RepID=A0ABP7I6A6_9ACTN
MTSEALAERATPEHDHDWRLVSVETEDGGVQVREHLCATCSEVFIDG